MQDFKRHIKEAIALNTERLPLYAALTNDKSILFSKKLINYEKLILSSAWLVDLIGDFYQKRGIPFIAEEFIDMDEVNKFAPTFPSNITYSTKLISYNFNPFRIAAKTAINNSQSFKLLASCNLILKDLSDQPHVYCMTRHLIESIRRIAYLIPFHEKKSKKLTIRPPSYFAWMLIKSHLRFLNQSSDFDKKAAFIQENGTPFLYQDLPHIHTKSSYTVDC